MSKIIEVTPDNIDSSIMSKAFVVVDFYADWCIPCKQMLPIIENLADIEYKNATYAKVDAGSDDLSDLTSIMNVRNIPTYIVFKNGEEVARKSGTLSAEKFKEFIDSAI
jgi:thioredoxin